MNNSVNVEFQSVAYGDGILMAVGPSTVSRLTPDTIEYYYGLSWKTKNTGVWMKSAVFNNGKFVTVGSNGGIWQSLLTTQHGQK